MLKFKEASRDDFKKTYKTTKLQKFLDEFIKANIPVAEIEWQGDYANAGSCASSLTAAVKRFNRGVKCVTVNGKVYLINEILFEKEKEHE